ncbi:hypothetical protein ACUJ8H_13040 [Streptomyces sp. EKR5.2]|uniref:hypothetical protein n=1 Tax=Streptomyces sp. EKR5.2 TaxID=3461014 RepID=UPI00404336AE
MKYWSGWVGDGVAKRPDDLAGKVPSSSGVRTPIPSAPSGCAPNRRGTARDEGPQAMTSAGLPESRTARATEGTAQVASGTQDGQEVPIAVVLMVTLRW